MWLGLCPNVKHKKYNSHWSQFSFEWEKYEHEGMYTKTMRSEKKRKDKNESMWPCYIIWLNSGLDEWFCWLIWLTCISLDTSSYEMKRDVEIISDNNNSNSYNCNNNNDNDKWRSAMKISVNSLYYRVDWETEKISFQAWSVLKRCMVIVRSNQHRIRFCQDNESIFSPFLSIDLNSER